MKSTKMHPDAVAMTTPVVLWTENIWIEVDAKASQDHEVYSCNVWICQT